MFPRWPLGTDPKWLPLPQGSWEEELEGYSGKVDRGKGVIGKNKVDIQPRSTLPLRSAYMGDRTDQEENFQEEPTQTSLSDLYSQLTQPP